MNDELNPTAAKIAEDALVEIANWQESYGDVRDRAKEALAALADREPTASMDEKASALLEAQKKFIELLQTTNSNIDLVAWINKNPYCDINVPIEENGITVSWETMPFFLSQAPKLQAFEPPTASMDEKALEIARHAVPAHPQLVSIVQVAILDGMQWMRSHEREPAPDEERDIWEDGIQY